MNSSIEFSFQTFLLGQTTQNVILRLSVILSILLFIWIILIIFSIIFMRRRTDKRPRPSRLFEQVELTRRTNPDHHRRMNSSSTSIASRKWYAFYHRFPSFRSTKSSANAAIQEQYESHSPANSAKVQAVIEAMTRRSFTSSQKSVESRRNSLSPPPPERAKKTIEAAAQLLKPIESRPRAVSVTPSNGFLENLTRRLSTQIPSLTSNNLRPTISRLTSSPSTTVEPFPIHWSTPGPHHRSRHIHYDSSLESSQRQLPLVMITDTNCSFTNIVELDTFEDEKRIITDVERRLKQQLKTHYRPRYST